MVFYVGVCSTGEHAFPMPKSQETAHIAVNTSDIQVPADSSNFHINVLPALDTKRQKCVWSSLATLIIVVLPSSEF